jgi:hypothetical protein
MSQNNTTTVASKGKRQAKAKTTQPTSTPEVYGPVWGPAEGEQIENPHSDLPQILDVVEPTQPKKSGEKKPRSHAAGANRYGARPGSKSYELCAAFDEHGPVYPVIAALCGVDLARAKGHHKWMIRHGYTGKVSN